jgi:hypothetical protein
MSPITLAFLTALLNAHGPNATLHSENAGLDAVVRELSGQVTEQAEVEQPKVLQAVYSRFYNKLFYVKQYIKFRK